MKRLTRNQRNALHRWQTRSGDGVGQGHYAPAPLVSLPQLRCLSRPLPEEERPTPGLDACPPGAIIGHRTRTR